MERRKGKRQQKKHGLPLVAEDDPVEYQHGGGEDDRDVVVVANSTRVKGSGVGHHDHDNSSSSDEEAEAAELSSEDSDSEEDYVAYGRLDVETATDAVTEWLRQRLAPEEEDDEEERANKRRKAPSKGGAVASSSSLPSLPSTRREWSRQADIVRLCRVERQVEGLAVVGLLHQAHLIRLVPPPGTNTGGGGRGRSSSKAAPRGKRKPKTTTAADEESEEGEEGEEEEEEGGVAEVVRGLGAEAAGQVGVEWVAQLQDMTRLEEALTQQLGDGSVILARVLPWVRTRLAPGANDGGGGKKKGGKQQQSGLPSTLEELLATIEQEQWGAITHRVRPNDVLHELELNELLEVEMERSGKLTYHTAKILAEKGAGGNGWKWLLGVLLLLFMMLPSWLSNL